VMAQSHPPLTLGKLDSVRDRARFCVLLRPTDIVAACAAYNSTRSGYSSAGRLAASKDDSASRARLTIYSGEKLMNFSDAAERHPEFAAELPRFEAARCGTSSIPTNCQVI
jgi:hypothetical protein